MSGVSVFNLLGKLAIDGVDETKKALDDVAKGGEDAKNKLSISFQDIGNKAGELGKKMALGLAGVVTASIAGVEATREFRQDYGKLETTFSTTNQAAGTAEKTFKTLFGILGEDDTAIETANHLAMMTNNEKDLSQWTDVLTGVYATFGDSLPLEGLAEAANETARVGQVTGPLADALNWAGVSEDAFNEKLEKCTSTQERERLIRETLNGLYGEASETYKQVNGDVIANNEAQANLNMKLADTMAKIEPLITKMKIFLAEVLVKAQPLITWIIDNINILAPIVLGFMGSLFALNIASKIMNLIPIIKALFAVVAANPIILIITAIIAVIGLLIANWDKVKEVAVNVWNGIKEIWGTVAEWFKTSVIDPVIGFFQSLWAGIQAVWDAIVLGVKIFIGLVASVFDAALQIITLPFRFIWENCKEYVFAAFEWMKEKIGDAINWIKSFVQKGFELISKYIIDPIMAAKDWIVSVFQTIGEFISDKIEQIKGFVKTGFFFVKDNIITPIVDAKNKFVSTITNLVDSAKNKFNAFKENVSNTFNKIKTALTGPIEKARDAIKGMVDKIKGFFKFNISLPKVKLPHFSVKPKGWKIGDLLEGSIPKLGIDWYAKAVRSPMLLDKPTAFGISPNGNIRVGGEAGSELVGGTNTIMGMISNAVSSNNGGIEDKLDKLIYLFSNLTQVMSNQQVVLSTGELVGAMVNPMDKALGQLADDRRRGR